MVGFLAGLHYWWPKMTGRMYNEFWGRIGALLVFAGFNLTFFPQFILGTRGLPRRYYSYARMLPDHPEFTRLNVYSSLGAYLLAAALVLVAVYLAHSLFRGRRAGQSVGRRHAGMAMQLAAALRQLRHDAGRRRSLLVRRPGLRSRGGRLRPHFRTRLMNDANRAHNEPHAAGEPHFLAHHFRTYRQQFDAGKLGMWIFLLTEILLFGGLFCVYAVYRANHPEIFVYAHRYLDKNLGGLNTCVLILSSLTMAWGVRLRRPIGAAA